MRYILFIVCARKLSQKYNVPFNQTGQLADSESDLNAKGIFPNFLEILRRVCEIKDKQYTSTVSPAAVASRAQQRSIGK
jgi:hypothetical protein